MKWMAAGVFNRLEAVKDAMGRDEILITSKDLESTAGFVFFLQILGKQMNKDIEG